MPLDSGSTGGAAIASLVICPDDGCPIAATRFKARGQRRGVMLIAGAVGVPQRFYRDYACHAAADGWDVLTWDWRGIAESGFGIAHCEPRLSMSRWGSEDLAAAISWAEQRAAGDPVVLVAHSFGGQAVALASNSSRLDAIILVGSQHGWLGHWSWRQRLLLGPFWYVVVPLLARLRHSFPSHWFGMGEPLPEGVALEWARWCRSPGYHDQWRGLDDVTAPVLAYSASDDPIAPDAAVKALLREYRRAASVVHRHLTPAGQADRIGHFGFFRAGVIAGLWAEWQEFLDAAAAHPPLERGAP